MSVSRKTLYFTVSVFVFIAVVGVLEFWAAHHFKAITFNDRVRQKAIRLHPDLVCIGNSVLGENIVRHRFETGISKLLGRKAKILFISKGGMHTAWQYLVFKNQITTTGVKNIPVLFFNYEDFLIRPGAKVTNLAKSEYLIKENMRGEEPIFLEKVGEKSSSFSSGFPYLYSQRYNIKRLITSKFVRWGLKATMVSNGITSRRWKLDDQSAVQWLLSMVFKGSNFRSGQQVDEGTTADRPIEGIENSQKLLTQIDRSFIPEILKHSGDYKIIFVQSNSNPSMKLMKDSLKPYSLALERYITERGGHFIDLNRVPELQMPGLMHDSRHFTKGRPRQLNTDSLLKILGDRRLIR